jgi:hypothetical protein
MRSIYERNEMNTETPIFVLSPAPSKKEKNPVVQVLGLAILAGVGYMVYKEIQTSAEKSAKAQVKTSQTYPYGPTHN